jgi:Restriction Endonuclease associating with ARP
MRLLAQYDPDTYEPLGVWAGFGDPAPHLEYEDAEARLYAEQLLAEAGADAWPALADRLAERTPVTAWWEVVDVDVDDARDALDELRRAWAGTSAPPGSARFDAAARRLRFHRRRGRELARYVLGGDAVAFEGDRRISSTLSAWSDPSGERLVMVVAEGEDLSASELALAYGLYFQRDRDLHLVIPGAEVEKRGLPPMDLAEPSLRRSSFLTTPVYVWTYSDVDLNLGVAPPRHAVLAATRLDEELPLSEVQLGDRLAWISSIETWAEEISLAGSHRPSYRAWHHEGRQVLKIEPTSQGLRVIAGTDYSAHREDKIMATVVEIDDVLDEAQVEAIQAAVEASIADRTAGIDAENLEHLLQANLATPAGVAALGLVSQVVREVPATRPGQRRAFIDLVGVDGRGDIHIVETKLGMDAMLGLQGLDYWCWASEHRKDLVDALKKRGLSPRADATVKLDFVIGSRDDSGPPDVSYLLPQIEVLDGSIPWRIGIVSGWRSSGDELTIEWSLNRSAPGWADHTPRFARRLESHLVASAAGEENLERRVFFRDLHKAVEPEASPWLTRLEHDGLLHRFVHHVRSSQLFALNLWGAVHGEALIAVVRQVVPEVVSVDRIDLEFVDSLDRLGESSPASPHVTQADVGISARDGDGSRRLVLVEVKLTEDDFGFCTGFEDPANDRLDLCSSSAPFGGEPDSCFKLRNHGRGGRREYDTYVGVRRQPPLVAGCPFRTSMNQPMRNVALAAALLQAGEFDRATVALCAHDDHSSIWRRWAEAVSSIESDPRVDLQSIRASQVLREMRPDVAARLAQRYAIPYEPEDRERLRSAVSWARSVLLRVANSGSVLEQLEERLSEGPETAGERPGERELAQRLEIVAELARSARADLVADLLHDRETQ